MSYTIKPLEELDILDDFLMNATANDPEVGEIFCRTILTVLLQRELGNIRVTIQRTIQPDTPTLRGIRMDVEVEEITDNPDKQGTEIKNIYDIEPNKNPIVNLPRHNRFYQAKIDSKNMKSGEKDFINLPNLFVITITNYDPFGHDYMMYTFNNRCEEVPEIKYDDGLYFIYFNIRGTKGGNIGIKQLLNYIGESKIENVKDEATKKLHDCVGKVKTLPEVRMMYMTLEEKIFYERLDSKEEGRIEGRAEGRIEGRTEGEIAGRIQSVLELLEEYGTLPEKALIQIQNTRDMELLKKWHKLAARVASMEEFLENM